MDIGKILGKLPWMSKIPLQANGMAAIPKPFVTRTTPEQERFKTVFQGQKGAVH